MEQRICLITPPSPFLLDERVFMNLGILRVGAALEQANRFVEMLDLSGVANYLDAVSEHLKRSDVSCFGITATTPQLPAATLVSRLIHSVRPSAKVILGGPHVTLVNAALKGELQRGCMGRAFSAMEKLTSEFDVLVAGDGERAIFTAMEPGSPKLVDADDPKSALFLSSAALSQLPIPARHLVDVHSYHYTIDGVEAVSMIAQLGCPFDCGFCGGRLSPTFRRVRMRSAESVIDEMTTLYQTYGFRGFMLYDDELNVNRQMVTLMQGIRDRARSLGTEFRLRGFIRSDLFNDQQAEAMYEAGFRWLLVGFESGSPRILRNINKKTTREDNTRCIETARRHGLKIKALMSIGHPGESEETLNDTHDWLLAMKPDEFDLTIITVYPGTPYYDAAEPHKDGIWVYTRNGDRLYSLEIDYTKISDYYKGGRDDYRAYVFTDFLSPEDLVRWRGQMEDKLRTSLALDYCRGAAAIQYEHSMGQNSLCLPPNILRTSPLPVPRRMAAQSGAA